MSVNQALASLAVAAVVVGMFAFRAPISLGQLGLAAAGWLLAFFGAEMSSLIGVEENPRTRDHIDPFVRGIGWLFILCMVALFVAHVVRIT